MTKLRHRKEGRVACLSLTGREPGVGETRRLETINGYSSAGDFGEARQRPAKFLGNDQ